MDYLRSNNEIYDNPMDYITNYHRWQMRQRYAEQGDDDYIHDLDDYPLYDDNGEEIKMRGRSNRFGHHRFGKISVFEEKFSMASLKMRDYNCIYESLMIIIHNEEKGCIPNYDSTKWQTWVLQRFNMESYED